MREKKKKKEGEGTKKTEMTNKRKEKGKRKKEKGKRKKEKGKRKKEKSMVVKPDTCFRELTNYKKLVHSKQERYDKHFQQQ
jgi:hypothetical protein